MTKYNNYAGVGSGNGVNKLAVLDPRDSQVDPISGVTVMKEILTIAGPTPDSDQISTYPNAVKEWCINSAVVDPATHSVLAGNEDGKLYRWDLSTNALSETVTLTPGLGAAYTPSVIGQDGTVYAINNATLYAVGVTPVSVGHGPPRPALVLARPLPNPFSRTTSLRFSLPRGGRATLDILDLQGRRVARVLEGYLSAGEHAATWNGRSASGAACAAGVYIARLGEGDATSDRRVVLVH
jgi:hypothetical protein